jgi:hypothetical protein
MLTYAHIVSGEKNIELQFAENGHVVLKLLPVSTKEAILFAKFKIVTEILSIV